MEFIVAQDFAASPLSVRGRFASQLRYLRAQKGFTTARSLAQALGIEENRYTRYERAEVEPSLTLIHRICVTLQVSPNDLLGYSDTDQGVLDNTTVA